MRSFCIYWLSISIHFVVSMMILIENQSSLWLRMWYHYSYSKFTPHLMKKEPVYLSIELHKLNLQKRKKKRFSQNLPGIHVNFPTTIIPYSILWTVESSSAVHKSKACVSFQSRGRLLMGIVEFWFRCATSPTAIGPHLRLLRVQIQRLLPRWRRASSSVVDFYAVSSSKGEVHARCRIYIFPELRLINLSPFFPAQSSQLTKFGRLLCSRTTTCPFPIDASF
jgi:hypothetical protein